MQMRTVLILLIILGCVFMSACVNEKTQAPPQPAQTPSPLAVQTTPSPDETMATRTVESLSSPSPDHMLTVSSRKDPIDNTITVTFDGGVGQDLVKNISVVVSLSTGERITKQLENRKGNELTFAGTKGTDTVKSTASYLDGQKYLIADQSLTADRSSAQATMTPQKTVTPASLPDAGEGIFSGEVQELPNSLSISVDAAKDPIYRVITTTFRGGHGQSMVSAITVRTVLSTGEVVTKELQNNIGATAEVQGTDGRDLVQVVARFKNGERYKIYEKNFEPRG